MPDLQPSTMTSASKVGDLFSAAGEAFAKLAELTRILQTAAKNDSHLSSNENSISEAQWLASDTESLQMAVKRFGDELNVISEHIKDKTMYQIKTTFRKIQPNLSNSTNANEKSGTETSPSAATFGGHDSTNSYSADNSVASSSALSSMVAPATPAKAAALSQNASSSNASNSFPQTSTASGANTGAATAASSCSSPSPFLHYPLLRKSADITLNMLNARDDSDDDERVSIGFYQIFENDVNVGVFGITKMTKTSALQIFFDSLLLSGGIAPHEKYKSFEIPYAIFINCVFFVSVLGCIVGFVNRPEIGNRMEILLQMSSHLYFASLFWMLKLNRHQLKNFIRNFHSTHSHLPAIYSHRISELTVKFFENSMKVVLIIFSLFLVLASISLVMPLFVDFDFNDKFIYVMPFWFMCSDSKENRFPVPFLCWNIDTFYKYALVNGIIITLFNIELFAYFTTFAFFCFTQAHFKAHLRVILKRINNLSGVGYSQYYTEEIISLPVLPCHEPMSRHEDLVTRNSDLNFLEFVQIIKHYQYLRR
ncbi:hypothetical protein V9T40_006626 [Parthenolecanium corni]|uniref:Uncharacterized protein n=1 Tax=Parthenolecanium corni TaxID=536013 RepID=A0AAN9TRP3_9HEMI